jgi:hypothetical protein
MSEEEVMPYKCEGCGRGCRHRKAIGMFTADGRWITKRLCTYCQIDRDKVVQ